MSRWKNYDQNLSKTRNVGGTDSPPPVYTVSPPAYESISMETAEYVVRAPPTLGSAPPTPGLAAQMRKDQLPPSYQQLFPSSLPPIEIVQTHPLQPPQVQQHVPYG